MKRQLMTIAGLASFAISCADRNRVQDQINPEDHSMKPHSWQLIFEETFDEDGLPNYERWGYDVGAGGWGNKELQNYTYRRAENARVENGRLIIELRKDHFDGHAYSSARLKSKESWQYGRFEVQAKIPTGLGTWPAIWMLPTEWRYGGWPRSGEIDIMEHVGYEQDRIHVTVHNEAYNHTRGTQRGASIVVPNVSENFNLYAIDWFEDRIDFWVNEHKVFTFAKEASNVEVWPFDQPFHFLFNIAFGGTWGGSKGVDPTLSSARMEIDFVRVYRQVAPGKGLTAKFKTGGTNESYHDSSGGMFMDAREHPR